MFSQNTFQQISSNCLYLFPAIISSTEDSNVVACSSATSLTRSMAIPIMPAGPSKHPAKWCLPRGQLRFLDAALWWLRAFSCYGCFWGPARSLNKIAGPCGNCLQFWVSLNGWSALGVHHIPFDTSMNQPKVCWLRGLAVANTLRLVENLSEGDTKQFTWMCLHWS